jgi:deoxyhypusine synthase
MVREEAVIFLGLAGPLTASGLRSVIVDLMRSDYVHAIVTSGANVVHDLIEAFKGSHYIGEFYADDRELRRREIGRIGNVYARMKDFEVFEDKVQGILSEINEKKRKNLSVKELLWEMGARIGGDSLLGTAYNLKIPIFSPALVDSMLGLQLYFFSQRNNIVLNSVKDMHDLVEMVFDAKKTGAIFLGGGVPKHYILGANLLRNGIDYGIQITMDREEAGSLSGAKLEEGISWGKAKVRGKLVSLVGDVTVLFPLLVASVKERLG